jgi:chromosome partitioning protein
MKTVSLINQKGGVGKTTLALHLATAFWQKGNNVLVLDLDPQASATEWHDARAEKFPHVESIQPARLLKAYESARDIGTDILILDTAPIRKPLRLTRRDAPTLSLCRASFRSWTYAPCGRPLTYGQTTADDAASTIETAIGLPVCPVRLGAYSRCLITGLSAQEFEPQGKAATEIEQLYAWICE